MLTINKTKNDGNEKKKSGRVLAVFVAVSVLTSPTFSASRPDHVTAGEFLVEIANAKNLRVADVTTAEAVLRTAGYDLPSLDWSKVLTEGDVAAIASFVGLRVVTSNPSNSFSRLRVDRFLTSMSSELSGARRDPGKSDSANKDDESGPRPKPKPKSPRHPGPPPPPPP